MRFPLILRHRLCIPVQPGSRVHVFGGIDAAHAFRQGLTFPFFHVVVGIGGRLL